MNQEKMWKIIDLYFLDKKAPVPVLYEHQFKSMDFFMEKVIPYEIRTHCVIDEHEDAEKRFYYEYKFIMDNISFKPATLDNGVDYMTPMTARHRQLSYFGTIIADVKQVQYKTDLITQETTISIVEEQKDVHIAKVPIMVKSKFCTTSLVPETAREECSYDPGSYFIVNGSEKVVLSMERSAPNKIFVFGKDNEYKAMINSQRDDIDGISYSNNFTIKIKSDHTLMCSSNLFSDVPLCVVLRALGLQSDLEITLNVIQKPIEEDLEMNNLLMVSLFKCADEKDNPIKTTEEAQNYLMSKISNPKLYSQDPDLRFQQKKQHLIKLLTHDLLPHLESKLMHKARYICYMANKLYKVHLNRKKPDDRDTFLNKRIEMPGILLAQLFRQSYKKMMNEVSMYFRKKNMGDEKPLKVINQIKPMTIEQQMKSSLLTGIWGVAKTKNGVARVLERLSYIQAVSQYRRIISPTVDEKNSKISSMRHVHASQMGFMCAVETPEGEKVGLVKNLTMMATITTPDVIMNNLIKSSVKESKYFTKMDDIPLTEYSKYFKILVNGDWLGLTNQPKELYDYLVSIKLENKISRYTSVCFDIDDRTLRVYSDGGRLIRPLLRVDSEKLTPYLTSEILEKIDVSGNDPKKISSWEILLSTYPEICEYVDIEQSPYVLISMYKHDLDEAKKLRFEVKPNETVNKYLTAYNPYTHLEFHPSMLLGMTVSHIPFCNMNQAPRNLFQYAQAKQAMCTYTTNWRSRFDISNVLYHPQVPVVSTRAMEYASTLDIPNGENVIVAIATYTGYNQEDSMVLNGTSVARGLFLSSYLKKYNSTIEKNQVSSQDDIHSKPDKNLVLNIKADVNYEKLNDRGFVEEETIIENGDAILGKVSPIQPSEKSSKIFKDKSEIYKGYHKAVVDKVQTGITNADGYEMYNMRIRSERVPQIGDKFSSRAGQKATCGILIRQEDMPFTENGIVPDMIINPNCIPSRMTLGQLLEVVMAKTGAVEGVFKDGTPFEERNIEEICNELESLGFNKYGYETMYSGITGKKFTAQIFIGPTFYQRLKHMVADKIHARATGPTVMMTRQPPEGRTKNGGLRFGEMERDVAISHGMGIFLKERMMECSDLYEVKVCDKCGMFVHKMKTGNAYVCDSCRNTTEISTIQIPYAFKLMIQELMAINILPRIQTDKNY